MGGGISGVESVTIVIIDKVVGRGRVGDEMRRGHKEPPIEAIQERSPN